MAFNFLDPENSLAAKLNQQNIDMAKGVFSMPTKVPLFAGAFNQGLAPFANKTGFSMGGMRRPDDETFDELDTTKMTEEERRKNAGMSDISGAPQFFPPGNPASKFMDTVQAIGTAVPQMANFLPRAAANAMLPEGMRLKPAPAAPQQVAPPPQPPVAPAAPAAQAPVAPVAPAVQPPVAQGMRAAPRRNVLGDPVQTLDQQGGYKVYGPGGAVATEIPWNPTDESALRRTLTRDEYLASQNTPGFAEGARATAANESQERQQQIQANAAKEAAGMRLQGARESATTKSRAAASKDAAKALDQLSPVIMGHYDQKGEKVPGAIDSGDEEAAAVFKQITSDAGLPADILAGKNLRFDPERGIMQILDEKDNVLEEGSPTGLAKGMFNRYYGNR